MPRLKYYADEAKEFSEAYSRVMSDTEATYIYKRLKTRYKLQQYLTITNAVRGNCGRWIIKLEHKPSVGVMAHEVAHGLQYGRRHKGEKWHCKRHRTLMIRVLKVIETNFDDWRDMANNQSDMRVASLKKKQERTTSMKEKKKTIPYKLEHTLESIKKWETKKKMADNKLKKLNRRKKLYETLSQ